MSKSEKMSRFGIAALIIVVALVGTVVLASVIAAYQPTVQTVYVTTTQTSYVPTTRTSYVPITPPACVTTTTFENTILDERWIEDYVGGEQCGFAFLYARTFAKGPLHISYTVSKIPLSGDAWTYPPSIDFYLMKAPPTYIDPSVHRIHIIATYEHCSSDIQYQSNTIFSMMDTNEFDGIVDVNEAGNYKIFLVVHPGAVVPAGKFSFAILIEQTLTTVCIPITETSRTLVCTPTTKTFYVGYIKTAAPYGSFGVINVEKQIIHVSYEPTLDWWGISYMVIHLTDSQGRIFTYQGVTSYSLEPFIVVTGQICA